MQAHDSIIDVLYKLPANPAGALLAGQFSVVFLTSIASTQSADLKHFNYMFILDISDTPWNLMKTAWADKYWVLLIASTFSSNRFLHLGTGS